MRVQYMNMYNPNYCFQIQKLMMLYLVYKKVIDNLVCLDTDQGLEPA